MHNVRQLDDQLLRHHIDIAHLLLEALIDQPYIIKLAAEFRQLPKLLLAADPILLQLTKKRFALIQKTGFINPLFKISQPVFLLRKHFPQKHRLSHIFQNRPFLCRKLFEYPEREPVKTEDVDIQYSAAPAFVHQSLLRLQRKLIRHEDKILLIPVFCRFLYHHII